METQLSSRIAQHDPRFIGTTKKMGITFKSMIVECALGETFGNYYIYMDDLSAYTDVYLEEAEARDPDAIIDDW